MNSVNKTLYIPLYGKAYVSQKGLFLDDKKAEEIWKSEGFALKGKAKSKWLAYYMGVRSAVFDGWLKEKLTEDGEMAVIHIGCGLDSRILRVGTQGHKWYDVDFAEVIEERKRYYTETSDYSMIAGDVRNCDWLKCIPEKQAVVVMEGLSMYLNHEEMKNLMGKLDSHFEKISLLVDCYTELAAKMSKCKNPVHKVGVTEVWGVNDPILFQSGNFLYVREHSMIPQKFIDELSGMEKYIFRKLYAGNFSKKLYRLFEFQK